MAIRKNKKKLKKIRLVLIIILLTVLLTVLMNTIIGIKNKNIYTREAVKNNLVSGIENLNYSYKDDNEKAEVLILGKLSKKINEDNSIIYEDYSNKKSYKLYSNSNFMEEYPNTGIENMDYYKNYIDKYFNDFKYEYKYDKKTKIDENKCIIIEFYSEVEENGIILWIEENSNIIIKEQSFILKNGKRDYSEVISKNYNTGKNKKESIQITEEIVNSHSSNTNN